jgi:hypothetical protein
LHQPNPLSIKALQKVLSALKAAHQQRVQTEQLCIALKALMEKIHGGHKHNKAVVVDLELVVVDLELVVVDLELVVVEAETTKTLLSN